MYLIPHNLNLILFKFEQVALAVVKAHNVQILFNILVILTLVLVIFSEQSKIPVLKMGTNDFNTISI